jgi:hypothetical protein
MSEPPAGGAHVSGTVTGDVSGMVAIGAGIQQSLTMRAVEPPTGEELADFRLALAELRARIAEAAPSPQVAAGAAERVAELEAAVVDAGKEPDLSTMEYVTRWFAKHLPTLAGAVAGVVIHPVVGKLVNAAGDAAVAEFKRRFGA